MVIKRGGLNEERLYLEELRFDNIEVSKTNLSDVDMDDLIARHKARYYPVGLFLRPGYSLLDFPCGSGYAAAIFRSFNIHYEGRDNDAPTIQYAKRTYGDEKTIFRIGDLCDPIFDFVFEDKKYNVVACIEGLEHINKEYQKPLIQYFYEALKKGGTLVISSPEAQRESGPNPENPFHKWELSRYAFLDILGLCFFNVELVTHKTYFHTGQCGTTLYAICHKE